MSQPKVLLVDDQLDVLNALVQGLTLFEGCVVQTAENGVAGLEVYDTFQPDCVVIDVKMPQLNGIQLVQALRGDPASAHTPLIILSALGQETQQYTGLIVGVDQYLLKPITPAELGAKIREVLALSATERQAAYQRVFEMPEPAAGNEA